MSYKGATDARNKFKYYVNFEVLAYDLYENISTIRCVYTVENVKQTTETHTFMVKATEWKPYRTVSASKKLTLTPGQKAEIGTLQFTTNMKNGGSIGPQFYFDGNHDVGIVCSFSEAGVVGLTRSARLVNDETVYMNGANHALTIYQYDRRLSYSATVTIAGWSLEVSSDKFVPDEYTAEYGTLNLAIPEDYCDYVLESPDCKASIEIRAYDGRGLVGSATSYFKAVVPESIIPIMSTTGARVATLKHNVTDTVVDFGEYVQNGSVLRLSGKIWPPHYSPIKSVILYGDGFSQDIVHNPDTSEIETTDIAITKPGLQTFTLKATDSRGHVSTQEFTLTAYEYHPLHAKPQAERALTDGTPNSKGAYLKFYNKYDVSSVNGKNAVVLSKLTIRSEYAKNPVTIIPESQGVVDGKTYVLDTKLDPNNNYILEFTYADKASSFTDKMMLVTSAATLSLYVGGRGIAFGKEADREGFDCNFPAYFSSTVSIAGHQVADFPISREIIDGWEITKWASGRMEMESEMVVDVTWGSSWGYEYYHPDWTFGTYPIPFVAKPKVKMHSESITAQCGQPVVIGPSGTETTAPRFYTTRPDSTAGTYLASIHAKGWWDAEALAKIEPTTIPAKTEQL